MSGPPWFPPIVAHRTALGGISVVLQPARGSDTVPLVLSAQPAGARGAAADRRHGCG